jgi:hypothetical protein
MRIALNMTAEKSALKDSLSQAKLLLDVKNAREFLALLRHVGHPGFGKTVTYGCVFYKPNLQIQKIPVLMRAWKWRDPSTLGCNSHSTP